MEDSRKDNFGQEAWPPLPLAAWQETYAALHIWMQIVGKVRLALAPMESHWWQVPLYVSCSGLTTSSIPYGTRTFHIDFDFLRHRLYIGTNGGDSRSFPLEPMSVADFYRRMMEELNELGLNVSIWPVPVEMAEAIPFEENDAPGAYDPEYAQRFWRVLVQVDRVFKLFRSEYVGKVSPSHFFWGACDLAITRFSGLRAPLHPGGVPNVGDHVMHEAYSHEVSSAGFWPGGGAVPEVAFYAYAYPEPEGFKTYPVRPEAAYYHPEMREFILPYEVVRTAKAPDEALLGFLRSTYEAAAHLGAWDRAALERDRVSA